MKFLYCSILIALSFIPVAEAAEKSGPFSAGFSAAYVKSENYAPLSKFARIFSQDDGDHFENNTIQFGGVFNIQTFGPLGRICLEKSLAFSYTPISLFYEDFNQIVHKSTQYPYFNIIETSKIYKSLKFSLSSITFGMISKYDPFNCGLQLSAGPQIRLNHIGIQEIKAEYGGIIDSSFQTNYSGLRNVDTAITKENPVKYYSADSINDFILNIGYTIGVKYSFHQAGMTMEPFLLVDAWIGGFDEMINSDTDLRIGINCLWNL